MGNVFGPKRDLVLVVDDDQCMRFLLDTVFQQVGFQVAFATNGKEAIEKVDICKPTMIIMDFNMPVMNGIQATKRIYQLYPFIPVIMLTANRSPELVCSAKIAGVTRVLYKPISYDDLVVNVNEVLQSVKHCI